MSVLGTKCLQPDGREPDHELRVAVERLDAEDVADAELRMPDAHAGAQRHPGGLIFVLVRVGRRFFADAVRSAPATAAVAKVSAPCAVRVRAELVEVALIAALGGARG